MMVAVVITVVMVIVVTPAADQGQSRHGEKDADGFHKLDWFSTDQASIMPLVFPIKTASAAGRPMQKTCRRCSVP